MIATPTNRAAHFERTPRAQKSISRRASSGGRKSSTASHVA
jgi:hypothetical protein